MSSCNFCSYPMGEKNFWEKIVDLINLDKLKDNNGKLLYPNSNYTYCKKCWKNRAKLDFKCENCLIDYEAYSCEKNMPLLKNQPCGQIDEKDYKRVCYNCKCDGEKCDYC